MSTFAMEFLRCVLHLPHLYARGNSLVSFDIWKYVQIYEENSYRRMFDFFPREVWSFNIIYFVLLLVLIEHTELWRPPDPEEKNMRRIFKPRTQTHWQWKKVWQHQCCWRISCLTQPFMKEKHTKNNISNSAKIQ